MTKLVNKSTEHPVFVSEGLPEWHPGQELNVREGLAVQLLDREDGSFALAEGEDDPRGHAAAELESEAVEPDPETADVPVTVEGHDSEPESAVAPGIPGWPPDTGNSEQH